MGTEIYKTLLEDLNKGEEVALITKYNLETKKVEKNIYNLEELEGNEGVLVASKIADRFGITRSVVVNALRKLESAGVVETRSSGMKGTYIKVVNDFIFDEITKLD